MNFIKSWIRPWNCALAIALYYVSRCQHWVGECTLEKEENGYTSQKFLFASSNTFRIPLKISSVMLSQSSAQSWVMVGCDWCVFRKIIKEKLFGIPASGLTGRHSTTPGRQVTLDANRICKHYISHPSLSHEFCIKLGKAETMRPKFLNIFLCSVLLCFIWYRDIHRLHSLLTLLYLIKYLH